MYILMKETRAINISIFKTTVFLSNSLNWCDDLTKCG